MSDKQKILDFIAEQIAANEETTEQAIKMFPDIALWQRLMRDEVNGPLNAVAEFVQLL